MSGGSPIEEVGETYAAALAAIHAAAFSPPAAWSEAAMAALLAGPGCFGLIDHRGGCALVRVIGEEAELLTLAVACSAQRQGIGSGLLHAAMVRAARSGATAIFLEVSKANRAACALYTAAGFLEIGRRRGYYFDGTDAVVLRAPLDRCSGASAAPPQQQ